MLKIYSIIALLTLSSSLVCGQNFTQTGRDTSKNFGLYSPEYLPPADEQPVIVELGLGLGLPYGTIGGKISVGNSIVTGDIGLGMVPLSWDLSGSFGATLNLLDRYSPVRLKLSGLWSNSVCTIIFINQTFGQSLLTGDVLYKEIFPGFAFYGGVDIRLGKTSPYCVEFRVGGISPTAGIGEIKKRYDSKREELQYRGYNFDKEYLSLRNFPFISAGINYVIGRSLVLR